MSSLNYKQRLFVAEYLTDFNGTRAAERAGYSARTANEQAARLLANASVQAEVEAGLAERCKRLGITTDRVLNELALIGFANMADYMSFNSGEPFLDFSAMDRDKAAAIQELTVDAYQDGKGEDAREVKRVRFKLGDKRGSLELLGKHLKLFTDKTEISGPNGGPIDYREATELDLNERIKQLEHDLGLATQIDDAGRASVVKAGTSEATGAPQDQPLLPPDGSIAP